MKKNLLAMVVGVLLVVLIFSSGCLEDNGSPFHEPTTFYVSLNGTGNYTRIQDALDAAVDNDTIYVQPGRYNETLIIDKTIRLIGAGDTVTSLVYSTSGSESDDPKSDDLNIVYVIADHCEISGFSVIRSGISSKRVRGLYLKSTNSIVANNSFLNCTHGVFLRNAQNNTIYLNTFSNNQYGIYLEVSPYNQVYKNIFSSNIQNGICIASGSDNNEIFHNTIVDNYEGVRIKGSKYNQVFENRIDNNIIGVQFCCNGIFNMVYKNLFVKNDYHAEDELTNEWDDGSVGNYWDDYTYLYPNATVVDGVWDTPYVIAGTEKNSDRYPLVNPIYFEPSLF